MIAERRAALRRGGALLDVGRVEQAAAVYSALVKASRNGFR